MPEGCNHRILDENTLDKSRLSIARNTSVPPIHYLCLFALVGSIAVAFAEPTTGVGMLIAGLILKKKLLPESEYMTGMKNDYDQLKKKLGRTSMLKPPD